MDVFSINKIVQHSKRHMVVLSVSCFWDSITKNANSPDRLFICFFYLTVYKNWPPADFIFKTNDGQHITKVTNCC